MSLLLLNLVYVKQADSERLGGGGLPSSRRRKQECHFGVQLSYFKLSLSSLVVVVLSSRSEQM